MIPALHSWGAELNKEAARRLGKFCLVVGSVELALIPLYVFTDILPLALFDYVLDGIFIASSFILYYLIRTERYAPKVLLNLGYGWAMVGCFALGVVVNGMPLPETPSMDWSPIAVWAVVFSVVLPARTGKVVLMATLIVAMDPLSLLTLIASGRIPAPPAITAARFVPHVVAVVLAALVSRIVYRLGVQATEALEMGSYRLETMLGRGGMGEVWRAQHRLLARPAAVKLMHPEVLGGDAPNQQTGLKRFEREAQATALLRSPHTIQLYDFGVADDGTFYYVMELLEGFDVETIVKRFGPVPAERAIFFLQQICESLGEAHEMGFIHRDIKPGNVYVCRYGREVDFIKVLDFGLVKERGEAESGLGELTAEDAVSGTPGYMAPEQILGDRPTDVRADIYALGCLAYWLVTGELVFRGATAMDTVVQHVREQPVPPSQRTELDIPVSLEQVILRCLEKDPDDRPQTVDELSQLLGACEVKTPWTGEGARDWWSMHVASGSALAQPPASP
jgi:serine/threonine-protein kinase